MFGTCSTYLVIFKVMQFVFITIFRVENNLVLVIELAKLLYQ